MIGATFVLFVTSLGMFYMGFLALIHREQMRSERIPSPKDYLNWALFFFGMAVVCLILAVANLLVGFNA